MMIFRFIKVKGIALFRRGKPATVVTPYNVRCTIAEELMGSGHDPVIAQKLDLYQNQMTQFQQRYSSGA